MNALTFGLYLSFIAAYLIQFMICLLAVAFEGGFSTKQQFYTNLIPFYWLPSAVKYWLSVFKNLN